MTRSSVPVHVVLLPWAAQGHVTPMMQLAEVLASQAGFLSTLVLSASTKAMLEGSSAASPLLAHHPNIRVQVIDDGPNPSPSFQDMVQASATPTILQQSLEKLLQDLMASPHPVTCLISGTFCAWSQAVTHKLNIPRAELWCAPAYIYCVGFYHHRLLSAGLIPFKGKREDTFIGCIPGLPCMRASDFVKELLPTEEQAQADAQGVQRLCQYVKDTCGSAKERFGVLINSIYDLDSQAFDTLRADGVSAYAIGPLFLHAAVTARPKTSMYKEDPTCLRWLDGRGRCATTLYVAFGSDSKMTKDEVQELAYGLEASGQSFLWVIRPGSVVDAENSSVVVDSVLPQGFRERVIDRGLIVEWAPQMDVLAHPSIGGFMSHCGWNSTLETLWLGVPVLAWPQKADQGINKVFIEEEWKVGIHVEKHDGKVTRFSIEKAIRALMEGEQGAHIRGKVQEIKELVSKAVQEGGSSRKNLDTLIHDLRCLSNEREAM